MSTLRPVLLALVLGAAQAVVAPRAEARDRDDCQRAWSQAVRSYLTQNRTAGPDGKAPANLDDQELVTQAWASAFAPACTLEADGQKGEARVEAALIGVQILQRLDPKGCVRFMEYYMQSSKPKDVCDGRSGGDAGLRDKIRGSLPAKSR